jgi:Zn-dependent M28 family amino/carboxypeptidase
MRHLRPLVSAFCVLFAATAVCAQSDDIDRALAQIRPEGVRAHMRFLADDLLEGRGTGTRGYDIAAKYVAARFEALGLAPAGTEGYFQPVPFVRSTTLQPQCSLAFLHDGKRTELRYNDDYILTSGTLTETDTQVTAPLVFAGYGVSAPELGYDDFAGVDVRGKIVVVLSGAPPTFPNDQRAYHSVTQFKADAAISRGALAVLGVLTPGDQKRLPWESIVRMRKAPEHQWVTESGIPYRAHPEARGFGILAHQAAESLFAATPHPLDEIFKTAEQGRPQSFDMPVQASLHTVSTHERVTSPNVAALLRGSDSRLRDEVVVLTAHLDHLGIGEPIHGDAVYNGAYDNASGVASLLEMADVFARLPTPPRRSVLFLAVTGEEQALQGSEYFVLHPTVPRDKIVANINVDMFLMLGPLHDVIAFGAEHSSLGKLTEQAASRLGLTVTPDPFPEQVVFIRSDQFPFIREGIPALFLNPGGGMETMQWLQTTYHRPNDDMSQPFDFAAGAKFVRMNFLLAYLVAQADEAPRWNAGDFFAQKHRTTR